MFYLPLWEPKSNHFIWTEKRSSFHLTTPSNVTQEWLATKYRYPVPYRMVPIWQKHIQKQSTRKLTGFTGKLFQIIGLLTKILTVQHQHRAAIVVQISNGASNATENGLTRVTKPHEKIQTSKMQSMSINNDSSTVTFFYSKYVCGTHDFKSNLKISFHKVEAAWLQNKALEIRPLPSVADYDSLSFSAISFL